MSISLGLAFLCMITLFLIAGFIILISPNFQGDWKYLSYALFACAFYQATYFVIAPQLFFAYGIFESDKVVIKCLFRKQIDIVYNNMNDAGVGYYFHSAFGTSLGSRVNFMYLSGKELTDEQKCHMNALKLSKSFIKFGVDKELYEYLIKTLPSDLSASLKKSYEEYFAD